MKSIILLLLALGVTAGAFGAHLLKDILSPEHLEIFKTGVLYQITMSTVALVLSTLKIPDEKSRAATGMKLILGFLVSGIVIFSGSLYLLVLLDMPLLGAVTPIGGTFIIGSLFVAAWIFKSD